MSAMSTIDLVVKENHIPKGKPTEGFISMVASFMQEQNLSLEKAIDESLPFWTELCGDCLTPAQWNESHKHYTCDKCGA